MYGSYFAVVGKFLLPFWLGGNSERLRALSRLQARRLKPHCLLAFETTTKDVERCSCRVLFYNYNRL